MPDACSTAGRLLYCSTVSPQETGAGELLIHRHLQGLTGWQIMTVVCDHKPVSASLARKVAVDLPMPPKWLQRCKRGAFFGHADSMIARWMVRRFTAQAAQFRPDVVLTVMVPDAFMSAAALYAQRENLPLVLICHDDYGDLLPSSGRAVLAHVYRQAAVRLCVSKAMADEFHARYGVHGEVLPPIPSGPTGPVRATQHCDPLVVGFAGAIGHGYVGAILTLADALRGEGGKLVIASPSPRKLFESVFRHPAIQDLGVLPPKDLKESLVRSGVNVLCVIQSFAADDNRAFRFNFPSKLTEYSTYGLPLLVVAPENSSASAWTKEHPDAALLVHTVDRKALLIAVQCLKRSEKRMALAHGFHAAAAAFNMESVQRRFEDSLIVAQRKLAQNG